MVNAQLGFINNHVVVQFLVRRIAVRLPDRIDPDWFLVLGSFPAHRHHRPDRKSERMADRPQWEISSGMGELIKVVSEEEEEEEAEGVALEEAREEWPMVGGRAAEEGDISSAYRDVASPYNKLS